MNGTTGVASRDLTRSGQELSARDIRSTLNLTKAQFEYLVEHNNGELPQPRRVGIVRIWPANSMARFRLILDEVRRSGSLRGN